MDCARCGRKFFLHSPINALWCTHDQFFICGKCATPGGRNQPRRCPQCSQPVRNMVPVGMVLAVAVVAISLITAPGFYFEATARASLAATPQAPISSLVNGETVMISGNIATNSPSPTLSAYWVHSGKSGYWKWTASAFVLYQGSTPISVNVGGLGNSVYGAPFETNTGEWYNPGDSISLIGTVDGSNGSWTMYATSAAPTPGAFADPVSQEIWEAALVAAGAGGVLIAVGWIIAIRRLNVHIARERKPGMYDYRPNLNEPPGALPP